MIKANVSRNTLFCLLFAYVTNHVDAKIIIIAPEGIAGVVADSAGDFAPTAPPQGITVPVMIADNRWSCTELNTTANDYNGKIILSDRGRCAFSLKAKKAQEAGALGILIANGNEDLFPLRGQPFDYGGVIQIPTHMIGQVDSTRLKSALTSGKEVWVKIQGPARLSEEETNALITLYNELDGPRWRDPVSGDDLAGWTSISQGAPTDPCTAGGWGWQGVTCEDAGAVSHVTALSLQSYGVRGPALDIAKRLTHTRELLLSDNAISGTIPENVCADEECAMVWFDIQGNDVSGTIPASMRWARNLQTLSTGDNKMTGSIPAWISSEHVPGLQRLSLSGNQHTGTIPESLAGLGRLRQLHLASNRLSGTIPPALARCTDLQELDLSSNDLAGTIPDLSHSLQELRRLELQDNRLSGEVAAKFNNLTNLAVLNLSNNKLTNALPEFVDTNQIATLDVAGNDLSVLTEQVWRNVPELRVLNLEGNQFRCSAPPTCLPASFAALRRLASVNLARNRFLAAAPAFFAGVASGPALVALRAGGNPVAGPLPDLRAWPNVALVDFRDMALAGPLPPRLPATLRSLDVSGNLLEGPIPDSLSAGGTLALLDVRRNPNLTMAMAPGARALPSFAAPTGPSIRPPDAAYACPQVAGHGGDMTVLLDPSYFRYSLCKCEVGYDPDPAPPSCIPRPPQLSIAAASTNTDCGAADIGTPPGGETASRGRRLHHPIRAILILVTSSALVLQYH